MDHQTIRRGGKTYVLVERGEFEQLIGTRAGLPPLPEADAAGNMDAIRYARASIAREIIVRREAAGMTQTDLGKAAGVRVETINRIENGRHTADVATIAKIDAALAAHGKAGAGVSPAATRVTNKGGLITAVKGSPTGRTLINAGTDKRFVRRDAKGRIKESDDLVKVYRRKSSSPTDRGSSKGPPRKK